MDLADEATAACGVKLCSLERSPPYEGKSAWPIIVHPSKTPKYW